MKQNTVCNWHWIILPKETEVWSLKLKWSMWKNSDYNRILQSILAAASRVLRKAITYSEESLIISQWQNFGQNFEFSGSHPTILQMKRKCPILKFTCNEFIHHDGDCTKTTLLRWKSMSKKLETNVWVLTGNACEVIRNSQCCQTSRSTQADGHFSLSQSSTNFFVVKKNQEMSRHGSSLKSNRRKLIDSLFRVVVLMARIALSPRFAEC
jgi:hypothetical protein